MQMLCIINLSTSYALYVGTWPMQPVAPYHVLSNQLTSLDVLALTHYGTPHIINSTQIDAYWNTRLWEKYLMLHLDLRNSFNMNIFQLLGCIYFKSTQMTFKTKQLVKYLLLNMIFLNLFQILPSNYNVLVWENALQFYHSRHVSILGLRSFTLCSVKKKLGKF